MSDAGHGYYVESVDTGDAVCDVASEFPPSA